MKDPKNYSTVFGINKVNLIYLEDYILKDIQENEFRQLLEKNHLDEKRVKLLTAIIFLNMAPLHIHDFDVFLFFKAKLLFAHALI